MKKALHITLLFLILVVIVLIIIGFFYLTSGLDLERQPVISGVNPSSVADGTYTGHYKGGRWTNDLAVTISGGRITDIRINKDVAFADAKTSDTVFGRVISQQTTAVDTVSGATVTSKAYLKAIENAFISQSP